jgi:PAS domain S-box-containing protein
MIETSHGERVRQQLDERRRLQAAAQHFIALVECSDDAIVSKDLNGVVLSWNPAAERLFGYTASEMIGRQIRIIIPAERQAEEDAVLAAVRRGDTVDHFQTVRQRKDGSLVPISLTVSPIRNEDGEIVGASKIARDISEQKRADQERERLLEIARDASRLKDEFLATLSHELRTPLNGIVGYVRLLKMEALAGENRSHAIEAVGRCVASLTQIIEDMLDVSSIVSGKLRLEIRRVDLAEVVRSAVETVRPAIDAKEIRLEMSVQSGVPPVAGDADRLRQVCWNVLSNAVKFTHRGGEIRVCLATSGPQAEISVSDNGAGIPLDFLPFVFDRFRQADAGATRSTGGLGLGLAISRHLVELQGGRIFAESDGSGTGATFRIELPLRYNQPHAPAPVE